jgi:peptidoglycan hydrolase-like protein with peptidoglycan-binding domain
VQIQTGVVMNLHRLSSTSILVRTGLGIVVSAVAAAGVVATTSGSSTAAATAAPIAVTATATPSATPVTPSATPVKPSATPVKPKPTTTAPATPTPTEPAAPPPPKVLAQEEDSGDLVRKLEARLVQLGLLDVIRVDGEYGTSTTAAVKAFQRKHGLAATGSLDERTWDAVRDRTHQPSKSELYPVIEKPEPQPQQPSFALDDRCLTGRVICIDKTARRLAWVIDGRIIDTMSTRFGAPGMETREGVFSVYRMSRDHVSSEYGSAMPYAMFFSGGQAVHYSSDFAANGYDGASHGCVNVRDRGAVAAMYDQVNIGDKVVVYWS